MPDRANSFPKQNGHQPETTRYQSGFPNTMWGEPNDFVGSAPAQDRNAFDKYRAALANGGQAPAGSPFDRQYQAYKQQDDTAKVVREKYKKFSTSYKPPSKDQIAQSPQSYAGQPKATQDWHQSAAAKAGDAGDAFQRVADSRRDMAERYIGYDNQRDAAGHKTRVQNLQRSAEKLHKSKTQHMNFFKK